MRPFLALSAILTVPAAAAMAQADPMSPRAAEKPETVTKVVCERVRDGETGSRVGSTRKVCRKVQVPAEDGAGKSQPEGHSAHAH